MDPLFAPLLFLAIVAVLASMWTAVREGSMAGETSSVTFDSIPTVRPETRRASAGGPPG